MSIRIMSERIIPKGKEKQVIQAMYRLRSQAMFAPGFISAEAMRDVTDPTRYVILSSWQRADDWNNWLKSSKRLNVTDELDAKETKVVHRMFRMAADDLDGFLL